MCAKTHVEFSKGDKFNRIRHNSREQLACIAVIPTGMEQVKKLIWKYYHTALSLSPPLSLCIIQLIKNAAKLLNFCCCF